MKYTKEQINDMQELIVGQLKLCSLNHNYPKDERTLSLLLTVIADLRVIIEKEEKPKKIKCVKCGKIMTVNPLYKNTNWCPECLKLLFTNDYLKFSPNINNANFSNDHEDIENAHALEDKDG